MKTTPEYRKRVLEELAKAWDETPTLRLGQLIEAARGFKALSELTDKAFVQRFRDMNREPELSETVF